MARGPEVDTPGLNVHLFSFPTEISRDGQHIQNIYIYLAISWDYSPCPNMQAQKRYQFMDSTIRPLGIFPSFRLLILELFSGYIFPDQIIDIQVKMHKTGSLSSTEGNFTAEPTANC